MRGIQKRQRAVAGIPVSCASILGINQQSDTPYFLRGAETGSTGSPKKPPAKPLALHRLIYRQTATAKNRHTMPRQSSFDDIAGAGELYRGGADRIETKH